MESSLIIMIMGLQVDFILHLSLNYVLSRRITRFERVGEMYKNMGITIITMFATLLSSSLFLFGGDLEIFQKQAILLSATVGISAVTALTLFGGMLQIVGPEKRSIFETIKNSNNLIQ